MPYITILGAGSTMFARQLMTDILQIEGYMTVHALMRDALLHREKEAARYALMFDPLTAAVCSPTEISALFDEMWETQLPYLQYFA